MSLAFCAVTASTETNNQFVLDVDQDGIYYPPMDAPGKHVGPPAKVTKGKGLGPPVRTVRDFIGSGNPIHLTVKVRFFEGWLYKLFHVISNGESKLERVQLDSNDDPIESTREWIYTDGKYPKDFDFIAFTPTKRYCSVGHHESSLSSSYGSVVNIDLKTAWTIVDSYHCDHGANPNNWAVHPLAIGLIPPAPPLTGTRYMGPAQAPVVECIAVEGTAVAEDKVTTCCCSPKPTTAERTTGGGGGGGGGGQEEPSKTVVAEATTKKPEAKGMFGGWFGR